LLRHVWRGDHHADASACGRIAWYDIGYCYLLLIIVVYFLLLLLDVMYLLFIVVSCLLFIVVICYWMMLFIVEMVIVASGSQCPIQSRSKRCKIADCPGPTPGGKRDCKVGAWAAWSKCSASCGGGEQLRTRVILVKPSKSGKKCPALVDKRKCNTQKCPPGTKIDCIVGAVSWTPCPAKCGVNVGAQQQELAGCGWLKVGCR